MLTVWNRPLGEGRLFWEAVGLPRLEALRASCAPTPGRSLGLSLRGALQELYESVGFEAAFLGGGLLHEPGVTAALEDLPVPVTLCPDPLFVGASGGRALLRAAGHGGAVLDVGQTSVKARLEERSAVIPRDLNRLPRLFIDPSGRPPVPDPRRRRLVAVMVSEALDAVCQGRLPEAIVLGLPCPLSDALVPGGSTYGLEGDADLVPGIARGIESLLSGQPAGPAESAAQVELPLLVVNDAELAAESARALLRPGPGTRLLCLTLGFGPGAALLET